ncbi:efflux RND transporter periplasmic adaptor subunit [Paraferrimonas sp. SM1919]|uniref:efflux RND transporter periplasmic adaptor subunit n=1 Tax=Paraferrimonas sp. SM1919 TaxID=2662263 RepID=UPI0013D52F1F|nr:efflux RND transporter periplasmic adaptor subunit [Paraferrimonas sp. SM1919]
MKKIIAILVFVVLAFSLWTFNKPAPNTHSIAPTSKQAPEVVVIDAKVETIADKVEALGTTSSKESLTITSKVTDKVVKVLFEDGQQVQQGQLLIQLNDAEAKAKVTVARVNLAESERELQRISELVKSQTVAQLEKDALQSEIDAAKAELLQAKAQLRDRQIKAPFSGFLGVRTVSLGSLVTPSTVITTLDDLSVMKLDFTVSEKYLADVKVGEKIVATSSAYQGEQFVGKITHINSRIDPVTRSVTVRAHIPNSDYKLRPGMLMGLNLFYDERQSLIVPESAIIPIKTDHFVYVVDSQNYIEKRQVQVAGRSRGRVEIASGIEVGEQIVIRGLMKVRPGMQVTTKTQEKWLHKG